MSHRKDFPGPSKYRPLFNQTECIRAVSIHNDASIDSSKSKIMNLTLCDRLCRSLKRHRKSKMRFMHANKEKVFDQSKVENKNQDEKVKAKKSKDKIETLNKSMMSSDSSFNTDDDSEEEKEKVAPLNERPSISSPNVMKLKSLRLKDLKSIKKTLNIDEPKRISQKLDIFKHEFLYDKRKKEGSILNKMSIVSQNTLNFKPMISRQDVSDLSSSKPDIEEKSIHFKAGSILKFLINFIDENRRSLHVPRKVINYSNRTPDRKF